MATLNELAGQLPMEGFPPPRDAEDMTFHLVRFHQDVPLTEVSSRFAFVMQVDLERRTHEVSIWNSPDIVPPLSLAGDNMDLIGEDRWTFGNQQDLYEDL